MPSTTATVSSTRAEANLRTRVQEYWTRRQARDLAGIYPYYSSEYRARVTRDEFLKQSRLVRFELTDAVISAVAGSGDRADVTVSYGLLLPRLSSDKVTSKAVETWIRESDGHWYKLDEPLQLPFPTTPGPATQSR